MMLNERVSRRDLEPQSPDFPDEDTRQLRISLTTIQRMDAAIQPNQQDQDSTTNATQPTGEKYE